MLDWQRLLARASPRGPLAPEVYHRRRAIAAATLVLLLLLLVAVLTTGGGEAGPPPEPSRQELRAKIPSPSAAAVREAKHQLTVVDGILAYTSFIKAGSPMNREVALTFDDGPSAYTSQILATLRRRNVKAAFFVVGDEVKSYPAALQQAVREGHDIGNHTEQHKAMGTLPTRQQRVQLDDAMLQIRALGGAPPLRLFRPPYGSFNDATLRLLRRRHMLMALWSIDTEDYRGLPAEAIAQNALADVKPGDIILMHDGGGNRTGTVEALPRILRGLKRRDLKPVPISTLMADDPPPKEQGDPKDVSGLGDAPAQ